MTRPCADIDGVRRIPRHSAADERGSFTRLMDETDLEGAGDLRFVQASLSETAAERTLRGLHYQRDDAAEIKLVRCIRGRVFDVVVDLREDSSTYAGWIGFELDAGMPESLLVPRGCAHGFLTLVPDVAIVYHMTARHVVAAAAGVRWDDPGVGVEWPETPAVMSDRDRSYSDHPWAETR